MRVQTTCPLWSSNVGCSKMIVLTHIKRQDNTTWRRCLLKQLSNEIPWHISRGFRWNVHTLPRHSPSCLQLRIGSGHVENVRPPYLPPKNSIHRRDLMHASPQLIHMSNDNWIVILESHSYDIIFYNYHI